MDDIKCPMCGKPNPAAAEVCEFCQARLKPLILGGQKDADPADWLAGLRLTDEPPATEPNPPQTAPEEDDSSDWLSRIRARRQSEASEDEPAEEGQASMSDWLAGLREQEEPAAEDEALARIFGEQSSETQVPVESTQPGRMVPEAAEPEKTDSEDDAGWLSGFEEEAQAPASTPDEREPIQAQGADDLGWLSAFQQETTPTAETPAQAEENPARTDDDLGWLSAFQQETMPAAEPTAASDISPADSDDDLGWLSTFQAESGLPGETQASEGTGETQEPSAPQAEPVAEFDWLSDLMKDQTPAQTTPVSEVPANPFDESTEIQIPEPDALPDWLIKLQQTPAQMPGEPPAPAEQPAWLQEMTSETPDENLPSGPFTVPLSEEPSIPGESPALLAVPGQGIPDWLSSLPGDQSTPLPTTPAFLPDDQLSQPVPETTAELFGGENLPDWIGEETGTGENRETSGAEESPAEELEPAQLPTWLQTMRPVEAAAPVQPTASLEDNRVEKAGPLAGLRGLVNGSETVTQYRKPPIYTVKLQVTDRQRMHATLLENVLNAENQAARQTREKSLTPQNILRAVVTILLLAVLLLPIILNIAPVISSQNNPAQAAFSAVMGEIQPGDNILLAVEYEPGLAAELEITAHDFLVSLEEKNVLLNLISTNPTGPIMAEALLKSTWSEPAIQGSSANLGYISGGSTALAQLASSSLQQRIGLNYLAAQPYRLPGAWSIQQYFNNYKAVILLTDNVDTGRAWVEQISPALGETPLLIISSAQAAPILQAYTGAQVKSVLSGSNQSISSQTTAYQFGMLTTALLIIIGGLFQGIIRLIKHPRKTEGK